MNNIIKETILKHIAEDSIFIFPTQFSADLWADKIISETEVTAVSMARFLAWDTFKNTSIKSINQNKNAIPSEMRRIFSSQIIQENKDSPFLKSLINPEYAKNAGGFSNWISKILPSLASWKTYFDKAKKTDSTFVPDDEDSDLLCLYEKYKSFLEKNALFDPSWEFPPFNSDGHHYFIFFPEILSDYFEYEKILASSQDITMINSADLGKEFFAQQNEALFFKNSRLEVKNVALFIKKMHLENEIPYNQIAVDVPDLENFSPYLERELQNYQIPFVKKEAAPLISTPTGSFFVQIFDCVNEKFSFSSIRNLLLNTDLPWKNENLNIQLIEFGKQNNCVCGFTEHEKFIDSWESSFTENPNEEILHRYYSGLKNILTSLVYSSSFAEINRGYFEFKNLYFTNDFLPITDKILSRCLTKLARLIDLEQSFPEAKVKNPYNFFLSELETEKYLSQSEQNGVQILPYKMAATSPFDLHIVMDSSQASLSVVFKQMDFLRLDKRKKLFGENYEETNVSEIFVALYGLNSKNKAIFTVAEKTFTGYSQVSSYLLEKNVKDVYVLDDLKKYDSYKNEKDWFLCEKSDFPEEISELQKNAFLNWKEINFPLEKNQSSEKNSILAQKIEQKFLNKDEKSVFYKKLKISCTQMKEFFNCPRKWLNNKILELQNQENESTFTDVFTRGNIFHKALELYGKSLQKNNRPIQLDPLSDSLFEEDKNLLLNSVNLAIKENDSSFLSRQLLESSKSQIFETLLGAMEKFSKIFSGCTFYANELNLNSDFKGKNYFLTGKVDCILFDSSLNEYFLIDFKTSNASIPKDLYADDIQNIELKDDPEDESYNLTGRVSDVYDEVQNEEKNKNLILEEKIPDFQMPSYIHLLEKEKNITIHNAGFFEFSSATFKVVFGKEFARKIKNVSPKSKPNIATADSFKNTMKFFYRALDYFAEKVLNADIQISEKQDYGTCNDCKNYRAVCRRIFQISKKND